MKPRRALSHSLFILIIGIGLITLAVQVLSFSLINRNSMRSFEASLVRAKMTETQSFSELIQNDFDLFYTEAYSIFASRAWKHLMVSMERGVLDSRYIEYAQQLWSSLGMKQMSLNYVQSIEVYMLDNGRVLRPSSIVKIDETGLALLENITRDNHGITLINGDLYFWVPQYYPDSGTLEEMRVIAVAKVPRIFLRMYLEQFNGELSESNLMIFFRQQARNSIVCALHGTEALGDAVLDSIDINKESGGRVCTVSDELHLLTWESIGNTNLLLCQITPWYTLSGELDYYKRESYIYGALILVSGLMLIASLYIIISKPVSKLQRAIRSFRKGDLSTRMGTTWITEYQNVYNQFDRMADRIQELIESQYMMQLLNAKAELSQLQYQINPHFLYNTYFNLKALMEEEEYERASQYADMLGKYLGYITRSGQAGPFSEEVEHAQVYGRIQQVRFADRVIMIFDEVPEMALQFQVPRLILQPLIENAYEHGVKQRLQGGVIRVSFISESPDEIDIIVEDNGEGLTDERLNELTTWLDAPERVDPMESIALLNIQRRLLLFYRNDSRLTVERSDLGGLKCRLHIVRG